LTHESREHRYYEKFKNKLSPVRTMRQIREGKALKAVQSHASGLTG
jgi:hypothetical protein